MVTAATLLNWSDTRLSNTNYWVCSPAGGPYERLIDLQAAPPGIKFVVQRPAPKPVWYDWRLPSRHGALYYYQQLILRTPFRDSTPSALIRCWEANASGSMREECIRRGLTHADASEELQQALFLRTRTVALPGRGLRADARTYTRSARH